MKHRIAHISSWFVGVLGLAFIIWYFQLSDFGSQIARIGVAGVVAWILLTLMARLCLAEITVRAIQALGFRLSRLDAFWIGWIRTFANQIVPLAGLALYTREIRRKAMVPWSGIVALSAPLFMFAAAGLSLIGVAGAIAGADYLGRSVMPILLVFAALGAVSFLGAMRADWLLDRVPGTSLLFAGESADAFRRLSSCRILTVQVIGLHVFAILFRGARLWLLFVMLGAYIGVAEALLVMVLVESAGLLQITPGGLGLREGAVIGGGMLLGIPAEVGALVALIDRLFLVAITSFLAVAGFAALRR